MDYILSIAIFIVGLIVSSFLNICIYRIPKGLKLLSPPSRCTSCGTKLKIYDMLPIVSWIFLSGRCRYCKSKIPARNILVELLTGTLFVIVFMDIGIRIYLIPALILTSIFIIVTFIDIETQTIPNGIVLFGFIVAIIFVALSIVPNINGTYLEKILDSFYGALIGFTPLFIINVVSRVLLKRDGMGGGDMKLMVVTGLFLGMTHTIVAMLLSIYIGGLAGAIILLCSKKNKTSSSAHYMPFGPFLALGSFISMLYGTDIIRWYINLIA